jgi:hypothetical protein
VVDLYAKPDIRTKDLMVIEIIIESSFAELLSKPHVELQQFCRPKEREPKCQMRQMDSPKTIQ